MHNAQWDRSLSACLLTGINACAVLCCAVLCCTMMRCCCLMLHLTDKVIRLCHPVAALTNMTHTYQEILFMFSCDNAFWASHLMDCITHGVHCISGRGMLAHTALQPTTLLCCCLTLCPCEWFRPYSLPCSATG